MIDTICLLIPKDKMTFIEGVSNWELYSKTEQYSKFVRNPKKTEKDTGKYFPRLTGYRRQYSQDANVRIELSLPKLLYLNNLDELEDKDFDEVIETLQERLKEMGVIISKKDTINASVSSVHYSKNILLKDGYTCNYLISEMNKVNLRKTFDFARSRYINDGQSLYAHTTSHQLVIYDKILDLKKGEKKAIDKEQTLYQRSLFEIIDDDKKELQEIIRFEVRLSHKVKMNKVFEELGYNKNPLFKDVFSSEISKKVVNNYWQKLIKERNLGVFTISMTSKDIIQALYLSNSKMKPKQIIYLLGLYQLARDDNGLRELRTIISKRANDRTWYRIAKDIQEAGDIISKNKTRSWVKQIDEAIDEYKAMKVKNLKLKEVKVKQNDMETWIEENSKEHTERLNKIINNKK